MSFFRRVLGVRFRVIELVDCWEDFCGERGAKSVDTEEERRRLEAF